MPEYLKCVPSFRRPRNVQKMEELIEPDIWFVHDRQDLNTYKNAGVSGSIAVTGARNLCEQRQAILDHCRAEGVWSVSFDDDVTRVAVKGVGPLERIDCDIDYVIGEVAETMNSVDAYLGGCNYLGNFLNDKVRVHDLISAGFTVTNTESPVNWPTESPLLAFRDQWEYSLRHIQEHGLVARVEWFTVVHRMFTGAGGLEGQRTPDLQVQSGKEMLKRWPHHLKKLKGKRADKLPPGEVRFVTDQDLWSDKAKAAHEFLNGGK